MTETESISALRRSGDQLRRQLAHQYATSRPAMTAFAFIAVTVFTAAASFGPEWARLAGASAWEAAVWPVAVTAVTVQSLYCMVRAAPDWYPVWAQWLFAAVAGSGILLVGTGCGLNLGGYPHELGDAAVVWVLAVPGWSMFLSVMVAATFMLAVHLPRSLPTAAISAAVPKLTDDDAAPVDIDSAVALGLPDLLDGFPGRSGNE